MSGEGVGLFPLVLESASQGIDLLFPPVGWPKGPLTLDIAGS
jgi:hypothetical protein